MLIPILCIVAFVGLSVWITHNVTRPFGWRSDLEVRYRYMKHLNGNRHEILLVAWKRGRQKGNLNLFREISRAHHVFAYEEDMLALVEEMHLPPGLSIYSALPDGRVAAIDAAHLRKDHVQRTTDAVSQGSYDVFAVVSEELVDTRRPTDRRRTNAAVA